MTGDRKAVSPLVASGVITVLLVIVLVPSGVRAADALNVPELLGAVVGLILAWLVGRLLARKAASASTDV